MHSIKFLSILAVLLIGAGAVYVTTTSIALGREKCLVTPNNPADSICVITNDKTGKVEAVLYCIDNKECIVVYKSSTGADTGFDIPPDLRNALDAAIGESQNTTKVPEGALNDSSLLLGEDNNQTASKTISPTEGRFCKPGTGMGSGKDCVPCDPRDLVGCIDTRTGGPLDNPEAASEESNDTAGSKDIPELSEDFGGLEFGGNNTEPELQ
jgi:hypothetical protein